METNLHEKSPQKAKKKKYLEKKKIDFPGFELGRE